MEVLNFEWVQRYPRCVTNFKKDQLPRYQKAIEGWDELYISDYATDRLGRPLEDTFALMLREHKDLTDFWKKFRK